MKFYLAPMEGITGHVYRNVYSRLYHNVDKYFTPFITPNQNQAMRTRERKDVSPEKNQGNHVVVQILTNQASQFLSAWEQLKALGYKEVNLNLGCPSATVVTKKKGAGFLEDPEKLDRFFEEVFSKCDAKISVKTRIGLDDVSEWEDLLTVYNRYPIEELIVHPRLRMDFYRNKPNWEAFSEAMSKSRAPVCYNGDIFCVEDYQRLISQFPDLDRVMLGRGVIANPLLIAEIKGEKVRDNESLKCFHDKLLRAYEEEIQNPRDVFFKMKEVWFYMGEMFEDAQKPLKRIKKAVKMAGYEVAVAQLFSNYPVKEKGGFTFDA